MTSSEPYLSSDSELSPTWTEISVRNAASPRSISSQASASATKSRPAPPYSSGMTMPEDPELGQPLDQLEVELVLDVVLDRDRQHALVHEGADGVLDQPLLVGQLEVHFWLV